MPSDFRSHKESPAWILGAGRMDPFMTSPIKHYPYIDELIDHCKRLLVACSWPNRNIPEIPMLRTYRGIICTVLTTASRKRRQSIPYTHC
jgi:hypothetical protein